MIRAAGSLAVVALTVATFAGLATAAPGGRSEVVPTAAAAPLPGAAAVTLRWSATREDSVYGYIVYRSARREGPFRRLNRELVHVIPGPSDAVNRYRYVDLDVAPGSTYYYYLDTVSVGGRKERFSGVVMRTVEADPEAR